LKAKAGVLVMLVFLLLSELLMSASQVETTWNIQTVDSANNVGYGTSLALDSFGNPHISYCDSTNDYLKYAKWNGSAWSTQIIDSLLTDYSTFLALDSFGNPHISYCSNSTLKYAKWTGSEWNIQTVHSPRDPSAGGTGRDSSLVLDSSNNPHISYIIQAHSAIDIMYAHWNGSAWSIQSVDEGHILDFTSLALDSNNNPHVSYYIYQNIYSTKLLDLKYAKWNGSAWSIQTVDFAGDVGSYSSLALDSSNNPHISYHDMSNNTLKYAKWTGSSWNFQIVDSIGAIGVFGYDTSLALDSFGNPHISYCDGTDADLKYAGWNGSAWNIETVSSADNVGAYSSLVLDSSNNPHISYLDVTNGDLKYAFGSSPTPTPSPTASPTPTPSPTASPTPTPSPTASPTPTPSPTPTLTFSPTSTPTPTITPQTSTPTPNPTITPIPTPTNTSILRTPAIELTSPIGNGSEVKSSSFQISWKTTDSSSTVDHYEVKLDEGIWTNIGTQTSYEFNGLIEGIHTFTVKSVDESGLSQTCSMNVLVTPGGEQGVPLMYVGVVVAIIGLLTCVALLALKFVRKRKKLQ
jgi:hypothetical protein